MRQKLWLGVIFLALLGSQFGIAVGVNEWRADTGAQGPPGEQGARGLTGVAGSPGPAGSSLHVERPEPAEIPIYSTFDTLAGYDLEYCLESLSNAQEYGWAIPAAACP